MDHWGTEFWFVYPESAPSFPYGELVILSDVNQNVTVQAPCGGFPITQNVDAGSPANITICPAAVVTSSETVETGRYVHVTGSSPFVALFNHPLNPNASDDTFLGLPVSPFLIPSSAVGSNYRVIGHHGGGLFRSRWAIVAADDAVQLTYEDCAGTLKNATLPSAGDVFQVKCPTISDDATGSLVESTGGRFFLVGGSGLVSLPQAAPSNCCQDALLESLPATGWYQAAHTAAGVTRYWTAPLQRHPSAVHPHDWVRLVNLHSGPITVRVRTSNFLQSNGWSRDYIEIPFPPEPPPLGTTPHPCTATGVPGAPPEMRDAAVALGADEWCDLFLRESAMYESTDGPFALAQYALSASVKDDPSVAELGDPFQLLMVPQSRFACRHRFWVRPGYDLPDDGTGERGYVTLLADPESMLQMTIDGSTSWQGQVPIHPAPVYDGAPHENWVYVLQSLTPGEHVVGDDPINGGWLDIPVMVYVHGYRMWGAYAYPTGMITQ